MGIRKLAIFVVLFLSTQAARADVGVGVFLGRPTGFDAKIGLGPRTGLDIVLGWDTYRDNYHDDYGHITYLLTPAVGRGRSVIVPLRFGIGLAVFDSDRYRDQFSGLNMAIRVPAELGFRFRSVPLEIYGELALRVTFLRDDDRYDRALIDGGVGLRFYF
jgi:hypothetical protein